MENNCLKEIVRKKIMSRYLIICDENLNEVAKTMMPMMKMIPNYYLRFFLLGFIPTTVGMMKLMMMMIVINAASHWVAGPRGRGWVFSLPVEVLLGKDALMLIFFLN